jgi:hypothetical protein
VIGRVTGSAIATGELQEEFPSEDVQKILLEIDPIARKFTEVEGIAEAPAAESESYIASSHHASRMAPELSTALGTLGRLQAVARLKRKIRRLRPRIEGSEIFELLEIERELRSSAPDDLGTLGRIQDRLDNLTARQD